jgi:putative component of membrane protein insertase Oxa1/YidC/SpoIIIJ protein YidD
MQISLFDSLTRQISTAAITGYQKHISPHKGFACAHRVLYGGQSCSQYIKRAIAQDGLKIAFIKSRERFQACKQANQIFHSQIENPEPTEEEEEEEEQNAPAKAAQRFSFVGNDISFCPDCADLSCNCAELVSMTPDCGALDFGAADCSGADCSGADCSGADCSGLDCGGCSW